MLSFCGLDFEVSMGIGSASDRKDKTQFEDALILPGM